MQRNAVRPALSVLRGGVRRLGDAEGLTGAPVAVVDARLALVHDVSQLTVVWEDVAQDSKAWREVSTEWGKGEGVRLPETFMAIQAPTSRGSGERS